MKVTLRKAKALQTSIYEAIQAMPLVTSVEISEFDNVTGVLNNAIDKVNAVFTLREALWNATYHIRRSVAIANESYGIDELLNRKAALAAKQGDLKALVAAEAGEDSRVIREKVEKLKKSDRVNDYGPRFETIRAGVLLPNQIEEYKTLLALNKKERTKIDDQLLELNVKTEIALTEDIVNLLSSQNIL